MERCSSSSPYSPLWPLFLNQVFIPNNSGHLQLTVLQQFFNNITVILYAASFYDILMVSTVQNQTNNIYLVNATHLVLTLLAVSLFILSQYLEFQSIDNLQNTQIIIGIRNHLQYYIHQGFQHFIAFFSLWKFIAISIVLHFTSILIYCLFISDYTLMDSFKDKFLISQAVKIFCILHIFMFTLNHISDNCKGP